MNEDWARRKWRANAARRAAYHLKHLDRIQARAKAREEAQAREDTKKPWPRQKKYPEGARSAAFEFVRRAKSRPCLDCGGVFHPDAMEFDHRDPGQKEASIRDLKRYSVDRLVEELKKCDLVCACCHRVRTANRRLGLPAVLPAPEYLI